MITEYPLEHRRYDRSEYKPFRAAAAAFRRNVVLSFQEDAILRPLDPARLRGPFWVAERPGSGLMTGRLVCCGCGWDAHCFEIILGQVASSVLRCCC